MSDQDYTQEIIDFLGCECEVFRDLENDEQLIEKFNSYTEKGRTDGYIPVIILPSDILYEAFELALEDEGLDNTPGDIVKLRQSILTKADEVYVESFLADRLAEYGELHEGDDITGEFTEHEASHCFYSYYGCEGNKPAPVIILVKIPVKNPWEAAAWLPMGGFNDCPSPAQQVAVFRYWHAKYGAVPTVVTYDNWELELQKPPATPQTAEELAKEHFAFCYDRVMQGAQDRDTIRALAGELIHSTTWYFWWD